VEVTGVSFDLGHVDTREGSIAHALALEPTIPESRWSAWAALFNVWETRVAGNATVLHEKWNTDGSRCGWRAIEELVEEVDCVRDLMILGGTGKVTVFGRGDNRKGGASSRVVGRTMMRGVVQGGANAHSGGKRAIRNRVR
jgi:hypothetical protein